MKIGYNLILGGFGATWMCFLFGLPLILPLIVTGAGLLLLLLLSKK